MKRLNIFKTLALVSLSFSLIFLFSCSSDDSSDPDMPSENGIVGMWGISVINFSADTSDGLPMTGEIINLDEINATVNFKENGEFTANTDSGYKLKMTIEGESFTMPINSYFQDGTWGKEGDILVITDEFGSSTFQIETLNSTKLVLKADEAPGNNPDDEEFTNVDYTYPPHQPHIVSLQVSS